MTANLTPDQMRNMNDLYRDEEPAEVFVNAFQDVIKGKSVSSEQREEMITHLFDQFSDKTKEKPKEPFEPTLSRQDPGTGNGLAKVVTKDTYYIKLHISDKLYKQQPVGVLLRPIDDNVKKKGEAIITSTSPRSEDVATQIMPAYHWTLKIEPLPLHFEKWIGEDGYPTATWF